MKRIIGNRMSKTNKFLVLCNRCSGNTSFNYAKKHQGLCKSCAEPKTVRDRDDNTPTREQRILEHGSQAYAREEGHYDQGDE